MRRHKFRCELTDFVTASFKPCKNTASKALERRTSLKKRQTVH